MTPDTPAYEADYRAWLELDGRVKRLIHRWQRLETRIIRLDKPPTCPEVSRMQDLEARLANLMEARRTQLARLEKTHAVDLRAACAKLDIIVTLLEPGEEKAPLVMGLAKDLALLAKPDEPSIPPS